MAEHADAGLGALTVDLVAELELDSFLAVDREVDFVGDTYDVDADLSVAGNDDGANGEQVGADGRDQHGVHVRHHDGAVGRQVVGSGAGGRGDDDAVGAEGSDELLFDFDREVTHAGDGAFGDDDVVESVPLLDGLAVADDFGVHHAADLNVRLVLAPIVEGGVEVGQGDFGEEAERAEVDAEDGCGGAGKGAGRGEEGAIAAEDDDEIRLVTGQVDAVYRVGSVDICGAVRVEQVVIVARTEPCDEIAEDALELRLLRFGDDSGLMHCCLV